jgi:hypothetical protein
VSDDGFDFSPTPPRRDARRFEPPPWERDQFEQHAREQAEREKAEREAVLAAAKIAAAMLPSEVAEGESSTAEGAPLTDGAGAEGTPAAPPTGVAGQNVLKRAGVDKPALDEKQVAMMMLELRADEVPVLQRAWLVNFVAGVTTTVVGLAIAIWGALAFGNRNLGATGTFGGMVLVVFGVAFAGIGGWLIYRALRQRGVL